ncbi:hypothetical protein H6G65_17050 [Microcystis elabens FACHB-917]|nr:hypothetical protein [Microcystis elabens FACHB-917]
MNGYRAGQVLQAASGAGFIDLQAPLTHRRQLADHGDEPPLIHPLEHLLGLEAVAHCVLPQSLRLRLPQVAGGDGPAQDLGHARQLSKPLGLDQLQQQPFGLIAVLLLLSIAVEPTGELGVVDNGVPPVIPAAAGH